MFTPAATSSEITTGEYESAMGATVSVTNADGAITVNDATVIAADIMACNGIIHVIDKVLIPPTPAPEPEMSMSMSHSMSVSTDTKCHFCMDGMPDPDLVLPTPDGETCQQASDYAHTLTVDDAMCPTVLAAEALCCPTVTEPTMSMSMSMSHSMSISVSVPSCAPIYEIGKSDPNFSTLMSLIDLAQLAVVLQGPASFTVVGK